MVWLVGQHRFPHNKYSWELPEGGAPRGESPLDGARRELAEETGLVAEHWLEILRCDLSNSVTDESAVGYLAYGLREGESEPDGSEELALRRVPFSQLLEEVMRGEISDSLTILMVLMAAQMGLRGQLPPAISAHTANVGGIVPQDT